MLSRSDSNDSSDPQQRGSGVVAKRRKRRADNGADVATRSKATYSRRKAANACSVCRARKTKCDNELPVCGFCRATGGDCQYSNPTSLRYDQASLAILQRLDTLENNLGSLITASPMGGNLNTLHQSHTEAISPLQGMHNGQLSANDDFKSVSPQVTASPLNTRNNTTGAESPPSSATLYAASSQMNIEAMLQWPVFRDHLSHVPQRPLAGDLSSTMSGPELLAHSDIRTELLSEVPSLDPSVAYPLIENFIVNNLPSNPILDPITLRRQAQEVIEGGLRWDSQSCLVLLVLALGSISSSTSQPQLDNEIRIGRGDAQFRDAETYFWAAQLRIGLAYCDNHLVAAQCAFFTAVYLSFTMRVMAAWKAFAQAGTQCLAHLTSEGLMDKSLDQDEMRFPQLHEIPEQKVLDDSLYWVILKGEAELCTELGLPGSALHERNYPHIFPRPPALEELVPRSGVMLEQLRGTDQNPFVVGWFYYLGEIALKRLQNRVLQHLFGDGGVAASMTTPNEQYLRTVDDFDGQLDQWLRTLPEPLWFSAASTEDLHDHLRWVLRGHRLDVIELIRFPAIRGVLTAEATMQDGALHLSPATLRLAREYLDNAVHRIDVHVEEFLHRHQGNWLTIRGCTRSILALLGTKLKCQQCDGKFISDGLSSSPQGEDTYGSNLSDILLPPRWRIAVVRVLDMLRAWEYESGDLTTLKTTVETLLALCYDD